MDYQNLYTTHYKHIYYICLKFLKNPQDAEDMTQNVFMKAFNKIDTLENKESFKSWISQIANRACLDELKHKGILEISSIDTEETYADLPDDIQKSPENVTLDNEVKDIMLELINRLPQDQQIAIYLYYYQEMSVKEISEFFNCPEQSTRNRLGYARKNLRKYVDEMEDKGFKLRCIAILPFLYIIFNAESEMVYAMTSSPTIASKVVKNTVGGFTKSLGMKIGIAVASIALVTGVSIGIATKGGSAKSPISNTSTEAHDRKTLMKKNDYIEFVYSKKIDDDKYIHYGINGKGKVVEYETKYNVFDYFYKGYAVGSIDLIQGDDEQLVDKDLNVILDTKEINQGSDHKDYLIYQDKDTSLWGCAYYNGEKIIEPKYDDIEIKFCDSSNEELIMAYKDEIVDYYDATGKLIFTGTDSYEAYNFNADSFELIGNDDSSNSVLYSYSTGKKIGEYTGGYKGPVFDDSKNEKYILYDKNFNKRISIRK